MSNQYQALVEPRRMDQLSPGHSVRIVTPGRYVHADHHEVIVDNVGTCQDCGRVKDYHESFGRGSGAPARPGRPAKVAAGLVCPHCGSGRTIGHGHSRGRQLYKCLRCVRYCSGERNA